MTLGKSEEESGLFKSADSVRRRWVKLPREACKRSHILSGKESTGRYKKKFWSFRMNSILNYSPESKLLHFTIILICCCCWNVTQIWATQEFTSLGFNSAGKLGSKKEIKFNCQICLFGQSNNGVQQGPSGPASGPTTSPQSVRQRKEF